MRLTGVSFSQFANRRGSGGPVSHTRTFPDLVPPQALSLIDFVPGLAKLICWSFQKTFVLLMGKIRVVLSRNLHGYIVISHGFAKFCHHNLIWTALFG